MNLNCISKMSEEELQHVVEVATKELAVRFKRYSIGLKVKVHNPTCYQEADNTFLLNKTGKVYGFNDDSGARFYEITLDDQPGVHAENSFWDLEEHEFQPLGEDVELPPPTQVNTPEQLHHIYGAKWIPPDHYWFGVGH